MMVSHAGIPEVESAAERSKEGRRMIGQAIIDGLLTPGPGGVILESQYNQGAGGYWQDSGTHTQSSGDYHQGATKVL
jgi:hypothetical protein